MNHNLIEAAPRMLTLLEHLVRLYQEMHKSSGVKELTIGDEVMEHIYRTVKAAGGRV